MILRLRPALALIGIGLFTLTVDACQTGSGPGSPQPQGDISTAESTGKTIEEVIRAQAPGVSVWQQGGALNIRIPGTLGLEFGANPLVVLDGVTLASPDALLSINPGDVAQVKVLKDAAAALYGVRAQFGVLEIKTRRQD